MSNAHCYLFPIFISRHILGNKASDTMQHLMYKPVCLLGCQETKLNAVQSVIRYVVITFGLVRQSHGLSCRNSVYVVKGSHVTEYVLIQNRISRINSLEHKYLRLGVLAYRNSLCLCLHRSFWNHIFRYIGIF